MQTTADGFYGASSSLGAYAGCLSQFAEAHERAAPNVASRHKTEFQDMSNRPVTLVLEGNRSAAAAKNAAWQTFKSASGPDADYDAFESQFAATYDARVYRFPHMTPAERNVLFWSLEPIERSRLQSAIELAEQHGYIRAPSS